MPVGFNESGVVGSISDGVASIDVGRSATRGVFSGAIQKGQPDVCAFQASGEFAQSIEWMIYTRIVAAVNPTLILKGKLGRERRRTKTIYGQQYVAATSPGPVFTAALSVSAFTDREILDEIATAENADEVALIPAGLERSFAAEPPAAFWRRPDFVRNVQVSEFSGWHGNDELDTGGATGTMRFAESPPGVYPRVAPDKTDSMSHLLTPDGCPLLDDENEFYMV